MSERIFHKPGLVYFWALNDELKEAEVDQMIDAFADGNASAVCLHPRAGLLMPYASDDWFACIKRIVERCRSRDLDVWLYDEDPYPSGNLGGRLVMDHPELEARRIEEDVAPAELKVGELFTFPAGTLLWCGLVNESTGETRELTSKVGVIRQTWEILKPNPISSEWLYPATPLYYCKRSDARVPELAIRMPEVPDGFSLRAYTLRPSGKNATWGNLADTLNPKATELFIEQTHEPYLQTVGEHFGQTIRAIFTDEPKFFGATPWTPGMFEAFEQRFGYDLKPRLWQLFSESESPDAMLARLHYRQWIGHRFHEAWLKPVADWCRKHALPLVGHISPEDDPVEQTAGVTNLMPLFDEFELPGIDLIIPAVGDERHPVINVGVVSASSRAQQTGRIGVLSESLALSGLDAKTDLGNWILQWQAMMGVTTHVIHAAFQSTKGDRLHDAPPDWGPRSPRWEGMPAIGERLKPIQQSTTDAKQIAPVAILWPIRSFSAIPFEPYTHDSPMRDDLVDLLLQCLARQVGVHLIDEDMLASLQVEAGYANVGKASYSHIIIPECVVIHEDSAAQLNRLAEQGITVLQTGEGPAWLQTATQLVKNEQQWGTPTPAAELADTLPRLVDVAPSAANVRCTVWEREGKRTALVMTLDDEAGCQVTVENQLLTLQPGEVQLVELTAQVSAR